ncbi:SidA/IucD/PvdA family monooxygenase [Xanthomonas campestris pv. campestris]|uniref:SidA/IucD/PvdA family monooxygenase n=1 Tax=Xanthomonas campestris TaxID=339 RepID=UPI0017D74FC0|nr:SidA/IucD/PvdA family monooxygenase [Xanthomonas campestris]MEB1197543.1 SidA/IucD/PvdA family monooxygenase [Xanthomonas campestris pv. campestris]MEA9533815.1 SidA/IucD/PvdA family monooxygenase [Xanthomonas campestris]MEB1268008.1 SidA/IucD/PvdA family monooxygenase [Xanthomonas campestris pv. campestris]MEB1280840.1 SidA/IucD/PvdA family monooxygenase [Xanthomonas campestris pv. campestris]MEB1343197.1 SidA/IucD/PvdA family monooxygenase [Xanthomonas campestris pv. campestris]
MFANIKRGGVILSGKKIAIIGAGAKAAAIAVRATALNESKQFHEVSVDIYEKFQVGSSWNGLHGYTDGEQPLCTPIERDLGYPYTRARQKIGVSIHENYSWSSYLISRADKAFVEWVDEGRRPPSHALFAEYLTWAINKSDANLILKEVIGLQPVKGRWRVRCRAGSTNRLSKNSYDSIVVTGPGPANRVKAPGGVARVFDGEKMWMALDEVRSALEETRPGQDMEGKIAILGAGGTAAAILAWLVRNGCKDREIIIISQQPAFYTRGDSVFENRLFNDEDSWASLPRESQIEFADRLNRGVVWSTVMDQVSVARGVKFVFGKAEEVLERDGSLFVNVARSDGPPIDVPANIVFDAVGFNGVWWLDLIEDDEIRAANGNELKKLLQASILPSLMLDGPDWKLPPLYAPMLASTIGPGFQSLMSLGGLAHRILEGHLTEL